MEPTIGVNRIVERARQAAKVGTFGLITSISAHILTDRVQCWFDEERHADHAGALYDVVRIGNVTNTSTGAHPGAKATTAVGIF